ncbi:hypothetical protein HALLA_03895 (plasmid) [Halostagnicola larsenii XH-48]|uniref:Uncharacterized protein n=1 Tax=Halostagnicola larsenii XH-48 TaxID=797299 RepID=W0JS73_9EURY|nr:hypothetical protein [Halostagnicola larsenii]AHG01546.1 hypothetical protein HALLA_03895 [Halostagnicola larsenii XH-48]
MGRDRSQQRPSKYVVPTGSGYLGTYTVSTDRTVTISTAALGDRDWPTDTAYAIIHDDGVVLVPRDDTTDPLAEYTLCRRFTGARIAVGQAVIDALELSRGDDVRVYDLEITDGEDGLLLVDADDDPRIATDGGHDTTAEHALELTLEYTTINDRRRRITIVPDTGGEAWRITHEIRNGEWRETGREPISELALTLNSSDYSRSFATDQRRHTGDELLEQRGEKQ